jgi:hypothetical protein
VAVAIGDEHRDLPQSVRKVLRDRGAQAWACLATFGAPPTGT